ncbi:hypothetical protein Nepgr_007730 [Nepenthes gracilis]|uniref:C2H2-type domain-containing protein n=1 Tax=Nepenthes gracilis TaxID=150966 RepID=A0AAD3S7D9_NEPGR|nr:hypothetical protein Nepgr_007730 [Nepenthes gracilis]
MDNHDLEVPFHELPGKDDDDDQMESHQHEEEEEEGGGGGMGDEEATEREFFCFPELSEENPFTTNKALIVPKVKKAGDKESVLGTPKEEELSTSSSMSLLMSESRRCVICDKQFISGKALGGHMRIHAQFHKFKGDHLGVKKVHHHHRRNLKFQYHHDFPKAKKSMASSNDFPDLMRNRKPTCSLCNKSFPSMKSLFGHMRCHPEREWRGMQPPAAAARNSSSSTVSDAITRKTDDQIDSTTTTSTRTSGSPVDLLQSISGWSVTATRGRKTSTSAASALETDNQILDTAVYSLMLLGCADNRNLNASYPTVVELETDCESPAQSNLHGEIGDRDRLCDYYISSKTKKRKVEQTKPGRRLNSRSEMQEIDERDTGNTKKWAAAVVLERTVDREDSVGFEFVVDKSNDTNIQGHRQEEEEVDAAEKNESGTKLKRKRRMMKLRDLQSVAGSTTIDAGDGKYRCSTCHRCFPTYQALGGHRSSHYNFRNSFVEESDANAAVEREQNFEGAAAAAAGWTASAEADTRMAISTAAGATTTISTEAAAAAHLCTICNKSFPSGQALGGHKRCHWAGPAESSDAASSPGELGTETERRILGFDLNELPAVEEEDPAETEAALSQFGDGAATTYLFSSSHNSTVT